MWIYIFRDFLFKNEFAYTDLRETTFFSSLLIFIFSKTNANTHWRENNFFWSLCICTFYEFPFENTDANTLYRMTSLIKSVNLHFHKFLIWKHTNTHWIETIFLWTQWICIFWKILSEKIHDISHWRETILLWRLWICIFTKNPIWKATYLIL